VTQENATIVKVLENGGSVAGMGKAAWYGVFSVFLGGLVLQFSACH